jgi:hypothetical protein
MRITGIRTEHTDTTARAVATVAFEDSDRPATDVSYEVPREFEDSLSANPDAFLVGAALPAARNGERRIAVEGDVCPRLANGLGDALHWLAHWWGPQWRRLQLEVQPRRAVLHAPGARRTALFLSGGVDSLAALRLNRLRVPRTHPASMADGILVRGFSRRDELNFAPALEGGAAVARDAGLTLVPVATNVRDLDRDSDFWLWQFHAAALCSAAHALAPRISVVHVASSYDVPHMQPMGSHPVLDPNYASCELAVLHDGVQLTRMAKTKIVAEWPVGLANLRVCTSRPEIGARNCGRCEKCVRTWLQLLAVGAEVPEGTFGPAPLTPDTIRNIAAQTPFRAMCYMECVEPLERRGLHDLARAARRTAEDYHRRTQPPGLKDRIRRFDRRVLGGKLAKIRAAAR